MLQAGLSSHGGCRRAHRGDGMVLGVSEHINCCRDQRLTQLSTLMPIGDAYGFGAG
jgi:hypothetical protein